MDSEAPKKPMVRFHMHAVKNEKKSLEAGRPIWEEKEYIEKMVPGDKTNIPMRPVRPQDKVEFAELYQRFKAGQQEVMTGTPLTSWPSISKAQVEELAFFNVRTVEQLAEISDSNAQNIGPILELRKKARAFVLAASASAPLEQMQAALKERDDRVAILEKQLQELQQNKQFAKKG